MSGAGPVEPRCGQHHRCAVRGEPVPGARGHRGGPAPVHLGLGGLAQPQLEPAAEQVLERGPQLAPAVGRHRQVQAVRQALRGQGQQPRLEVVELAAQHEVAVDDEQQVRGRLVRELARGAPRPELLDGADPGVVEQPLPPGQRRRQLGDGPPHHVRLLAAGDVPTCGSPASADSAPPPKSSTCTPSSAGVWVSARASRTVRSAPDLPARGPPTTARCPRRRRGRAPARRGAAGTAGRPAPTARAASAAAPGERPARGRAAAAGGRAARPAAAATSSGGSHTRCAGGPCPTIAAIIVSSTAGPSGRRPAVARAAGRRRPVGARRLTRRPRPARPGTGTPAAGRRRAPAPRAAGAGPETYAARNRTSSSVPVARKAEPGAGGSWYASGTPSTARDSAAEKVRSAIR